MVASNFGCRPDAAHPDQIALVRTMEPRHGRTDLSRTVKPPHCGRDRVANSAAEPRGRPFFTCADADRMGTGKGALRRGRNCGFECLGIPKVPARRLPRRTPVAGAAPGGTCFPTSGTSGRDGFIEGAMTTMQVFKRLTALAVTIGVLLAGAGAAFAGTGSRRTGSSGFRGRSRR